ncbi:hypothetical protein [Spiroplasma helicoides]|uniref:hypothetical protein n=1 Tax=Spiroplasma helicoides TaxID=216938 RepID=UPI0012EE800A|nr:hypothetical protein [Spiroplasma helicoides]
MAKSLGNHGFIIKSKNRYLLPTLANMDKNKDIEKLATNYPNNYKENIHYTSLPKLPEIQQLQSFTFYSEIFIIKVFNAVENIDLKIKFNKKTDLKIEKSTFFEDSKIYVIKIHALSHNKNKIILKYGKFDKSVFYISK